MRKAKIFALPSHTFIDKVSGVDYARIIQPMKFLNGYKDDEIEIETTVYDHSKSKSFDWRDIFQEYDIVYFNYTTNDIGYAIMGLLAQKYNKKLGKKIQSVNDSAMRVLESYDWPGNIRQLENVIERMILLSDKPILTFENIPSAMSICTWESVLTFAISDCQFKNTLSCGEYLATIFSLTFIPI